ncbi:MAG: capsule biosynthesis protein, partial [Sphingobacteriaceae bacterium]
FEMKTGETFATVLGPDDELVVNVFGYSEQTYNLTVNREGNIYIPNVGPINVNGLSIEQASARIKIKLASTIYRNISSGTTKVQISLGKIRSIRATVIGEARKPGTFTVSSLTTLFNLLYLCGGPSDMGSYRNIELIRGNQVSRKIDLYGILTNGDFRDNVLLEEGDVVRIPYYTTRATLKGQVKRPGIFEMKTGETFATLLGFAGGFTDSAYRASVQVKQITGEENRISDIPSTAFATYKLGGSDYITVGKILTRFINRVSIAGAVQRPGEYELEPNMTAGQLIRKAGGLREDAYLERGVVSRLNEDLSPSSLSFNVKDAINGSSSLPLKKDDALNIASLADLKDKYTVSIEGEVHLPGQYEWRQNLTLKDLILVAGGFTDLANTKSIEVSRRIKNANVTEAQFKQADIINIDIKNGSLNNGEEDVILTPYDVVVIRTASGYVPQRSVYVAGEIMNPGRYVLEDNTQ